MSGDDAPVMRTTATERRWRAVAPAFGVLALYIVLAVLSTLPEWESPRTRLLELPGNIDSYNAIWYLNWGPWAVGHRVSPLTSNYINYPTGINLMWNTWMPFLGFLLWPVTALGGAVLTHNLLSTLSFALAAFLAYIAIRRYVRSRAAALVGGLVYGFSPYMFAQDVPHVQMAAAAVLIPVLLLLVDEALVRQRIRPWLLGLVIAAVAVAQFFILEEYFVTAVIAVALLTLVLAICNPRQVRPRVRYAVSAAAVAGAATIVVLAYPVIHVQLLGPDREFGAVHDPETWVTDLLNLVVPTPTQLISPGAATSISQRFTGNIGEWNGYLGAGLLALMLLMPALRWRHLVVRAAALFAFGMVVLSFGPHLHVDGTRLHVPLPWWFAAHVTLLRDIQANRLMVYVFLAGAIVAAIALDLLVRRRRTVPLAAAVAAIVLVPLIPQLPLPWRSFEPPAFFSSPAVAAIPSGTVALTVTVPDPTLPAPPEPLVWQITSGMRFRNLGGFFVGPPAGGQTTLIDVSQMLGGAAPTAPGDAERAAFTQEMQTYHIGAVIMGSVPDQARAISILTSIVGVSPIASGGVDVWVLPGSGG